MRKRVRGERAEAGTGLTGIVEHEKRVDSATIAVGDSAAVTSAVLPRRPVGVFVETALPGRAPPPAVEIPREEGGDRASVASEATLISRILAEPRSRHANGTDRYSFRWC